jgi:hypothetical protein
VLQDCIIVALQGCMIVVLQSCVMVLLRARLRDCCVARLHDYSNIKYFKNDIFIERIFRAPRPTTMLSLRNKIRHVYDEIDPQQIINTFNALPVNDMHPVLLGFCSSHFLPALVRTYNAGLSFALLFFQFHHVFILCMRALLSSKQV